MGGQGQQSERKSGKTRTDANACVRERQTGDHKECGSENINQRKKPTDARRRVKNKTSRASPKFFPRTEAQMKTYLEINQKTKAFTRRYRHQL